MNFTWKRDASYYQIPIDNCSCSQERRLTGLRVGTLLRQRKRVSLGRGGERVGLQRFTGCAACDDGDTSCGYAGDRLLSLSLSPTTSSSKTRDDFPYGHVATKSTLSGPYIAERGNARINPPR